MDTYNSKVAGMCGKQWFALWIFTMFTSVNLVIAQNALVQRKPGKPVICYAAVGDHSFYLPPKVKPSSHDNVSGRVKNANFEVEYINFPADGLAKNAFEFAVSIWEQEINSTVPIRVRAQWGSLGAGVLGQAIWGSAFANFNGAQHLNTFYPVALAEKIAGQELNTSTDADIEASFNSTINWYYGTDGSTPAGKMDLVTVVLHEIGHGLGHTDTYDVEGSEGSVGLDENGTDIPFVFDLYVEHASGQNLFTEVLSPSAAMRSQLISGNLVFDGIRAKSSNGGVSPKLYAPSPYDEGSSVAHLDESFFNGTANALMTPQIATKEAIHNPGSILLDILTDIGWETTRIDHLALKDSERTDGAPYVITATVVSDNGYTPASVKLHYTSDGTNFTSVTMTATGTHTFEAALPGTLVPKTYQYYLSADDILGRTFTNPGRIQTQHAPSQQQVVTVRLGPDTEKPVIAHNPVVYIFQGAEEFSLTATVTDNLGVDEVVVEYKVKGVAKPTVAMTPGAGENEFEATISLPPGLVLDDEVEYRIVARDDATIPNEKAHPEADYFPIFVTGIRPTQDTYINDFNTVSHDFIGNAFSITTHTGFDNPAIHSKHPYDNGSGPDNESNYTFQLQVPIRLAAENAMILFDEVALIEPGEPGSVFGSPEFYDYVVVEGSSDMGTTWHHFASGYDTRAYPDWWIKWNSTKNNNNSTAVADKTLFRKRAISMLANGKFSAGQEILIRFRLFADPAAYGWGWVIDNLYIQDPITATHESNTQFFNVYPNPVRDKLVIQLPGVVEHLAVSIADLHGRVVARFDDVTSGEIDLRNLPDGLYVVQAHTRNKTFLRKVVKSSQ